MKRPKISRRAETRPYGRVSAPTGNCRKFLTQLFTTPKGRDRLGSCLRMLEQLESCGIVSLPGEAAGIENGNRGSETAAYEPLGSGFRHRVRVAGADATGTGDCGGGGGR